MKFPLNEAKQKGITSVGIASYNGHLEILDTLINAGADSHRTSQQGIGPLYLAIKGNHL